jgi:hypothetical protein
LPVPAWLPLRAWLPPVARDVRLRAGCATGQSDYSSPMASELRAQLDGTCTELIAQRSKVLSTLPDHRTGT